MSSRLQTAWTFSRVFLHNGACPAAVHTIACDYLPLMTHTTWELRLTRVGNTDKEIQKEIITWLTYTKAIYLVASVMFKMLVCVCFICVYHSALYASQVEAQLCTIRF